MRVRDRRRGSLERAAKVEGVSDGTYCLPFVWREMFGLCKLVDVPKLVDRCGKSIKPRIR